MRFLNVNVTIYANEPAGATVQVSCLLTGTQTLAVLKTPQKKKDTQEMFN
jgi:hypothetical protein